METKTKETIEHRVDSEQGMSRLLKRLNEQTARIVELEAQVTTLTRQLVERDTAEERGEVVPPGGTKYGPVGMSVTFRAAQVRQMYLQGEREEDGITDRVAREAVGLFFRQHAKTIARHVRLTRTANPFDGGFDITADLIVGGGT